MTAITNTARRGSGQPPDWKETLGRVGLVGKGVLYVILGVLAIQIATGDQQTDASQTGAVQWLATQPFGKFLLVALTVALFAMAVWRGLDAWVGDPVEGSETSDRVKYGAEAVIYGGLAVLSLVTTVSNWSGSGSSGGSGSGSGGGQSQQQATATVLEWPAGQWLVAAAGIAVIALAIYMAKKHVVDTEFTERLDLEGRHWLEPLGRVGYAARAVIYVVVGWFLLQAGLTYDPDQAKGLSGSLRELAGDGWGQALLWFVAVGLLVYGVYAVAEAKFRRAA